GVEGVRLPGVLRVQGGVDPALSRIGMGPNGMDLGDNPDRRALLSCRESGALAGEASPNDQYVVLRHAARSLFTPGGGPRIVPGGASLPCPASGERRALRGVNPEGLRTSSSYEPRSPEGPAGSGGLRAG